MAGQRLQESMLELPQLKLLAVRSLCLDANDAALMGRRLEVEAVVTSKRHVCEFFRPSGMAQIGALPSSCPQRLVLTFRDSL